MPAKLNLASYIDNELRKLIALPLWRKLLYAYLAGAVSLVIVLVMFWPKPRPGPTILVVNPTKEQASHADIVIHQDTHGTIHGGPGTVDPPQGGGPGATNQPGGSGSTDSGASSGAGSGNNSQFPPGSRVTMPVSGTVDVNFTDAKTGQALGSGSYDVTGTEVLTFGDGTVFSDLTFSGPLEFALTLADEKPKLNHIGGGYGSSGWGAYYQRDFLFGPFAAVGRVDVDLDPLKVDRWLVGVEYRW